MRLDKYLKVSRLIKRRTVANEACDLGRITVNDRVARASYDVKVGDRIAHPLRRAHPRGRGPLRGGQRRQGGRRRALPRAAEQLTQSRHNPDTPPIHSGVWEIIFSGGSAMPYDTLPPAATHRVELDGASA